MDTLDLVDIPSLQWKKILFFYIVSFLMLILYMKLTEKIPKSELLYFVFGQLFRRRSKNFNFFSPHINYIYIILRIYCNRSWFYELIISCTFTSPYCYEITVIVKFLNKMVISISNICVTF